MHIVVFRGAQGLRLCHHVASEVVQVSHEEEAVKEVQSRDDEEEQTCEYPHVCLVIAILLKLKCDSCHKEIYHSGQEQACKYNMKN